MRPAAALVAILALAACSGGGGETKTAAYRSASSSTSSPDVVASSTTTVGEAGAPSRSAPARHETRSDGRPAAPATSGDRIALPLPEGSHAYAITGRYQVSGGLVSNEELPPTGYLDVVAAGDAAQRVTLRLADNKGRGFSMSQVLQYADEAASVQTVALDVWAPGQRETRTVSTTEPAVIARHHMAEGDEFTAELAGDGVKASVDAAVGPRGTAPGHTAAPALQVKTTVTLSGDVNGTLRLDGWLDTVTGLPAWASGTAHLVYHLYTVDSTFTVERQ